MPHSDSAKKRLRQNIKRHARNQASKTRCKNTRKEFLSALERRDLTAAEEALPICISAFDRAARTGAISKAKADRAKSRLSQRLAAAQKNESVTA